MSGTKVFVAMVLVAFSLLTAEAVWQYGYVGFFQQELSDLVGIQVVLDVVIALSLVMVWMVRDARERGVNVAPYVVLTFALGSIGPLVYLLRRPSDVPA